jgi:glycine/D-amino acid oxidase-like deaminating enzyme/nitrite reductase/ring-hydroxylating ferredoxin subunit
VVGGGIAGLTTAYALAQAGADVVVIEADTIGSGQTARTSAHLASALDDRFHELERLHGADGARLAAQSHAAAIDFIENTSRTHGIDCDFKRVNGLLFSGGPDGKEELERELAAAQRAGLVVNALDHNPTSWFETGPCLRFANQAQFHPLRYIMGLATEATALGVRIHTGTRAASITGGKSAMVIGSDGQRISAKSVVVATNVPINDRLRIHSSLEPYRSYVVAISLPRPIDDPALLWDTADPYHYVRVVEERGETLLVVGGEDHKTGQGPSSTEEPYAKLEAWTRARAPGCGEVVRRWSGQIIEPVDDVAMIGHNPFDSDNVFIITGDSGNGLTHGTLGGLLIRDLILGRKNPWEELYKPSRFRFGATGEYARHNANVVGQYGDWLRSADVGSIEEVKPGCSALVRHGLSKWAVHRDAAGHVHACSAVCPHLGGLVRWNASEKTWDCPCHGSRFAIDGSVINGPANAPLAPVQLAGMSGFGAAIAAT